ncbi:hypothetical protein CEXT_629501 [Caerostris extrusa]|uniref:Uncharacterized protein n=1 Tax=Caerostris extrusa TaxID=172846 RepID=A0AAV4QK54_CAEEX|nr:hypothetical protein CEXT_629501 [Caerostris extrusa]
MQVKKEVLDFLCIDAGVSATADISMHTKAECISLSLFVALFGEVGERFDYWRRTFLRHTMTVGWETGVHTASQKLRGRNVCEKRDISG